jgi:hypothetical protein
MDAAGAAAAAAAAAAAVCLVVPCHDDVLCTSGCSALKRCRCHGSFRVRCAVPSRPPVLGRDGASRNNDAPAERWAHTDSRCSTSTSPWRGFCCCRRCFNGRRYDFLDTGLTRSLSTHGHSSTSARSALWLILLLNGQVVPLAAALRLHPCRRQLRRRARSPLVRRRRPARRAPHRARRRLHVAPRLARQNNLGQWHRLPHQRCPHWRFLRQRTHCPSSPTCPR